MSDQRFIRRLIAFMAADIVRYSRLMGLDEAGRVSAANASNYVLMEAYSDFTVNRFKEAMVIAAEIMERISLNLGILGVPEK